MHVISKIDYCDILSIVMKIIVIIDSVKNHYHTTLYDSIKYYCGFTCVFFWKCGREEFVFSYL